MYGAHHTNPLPSGYVHGEYHDGGLVDWTVKGVKITRLRLVSDPGLTFWDVSYCHGTLNGKKVRIQLPFSQLPKKNLSKAIVEFAKKDGVFAKGIGILDNISTLC